jgi:drug/metabolite transporter (DMT)-like permease
MNKRAFRADMLLLLTAGIWGFGFVAQSSGMDYVGPFTYNGIRSVLGSLSLLPLIMLQKRRGAAQSVSRIAQNVNHGRSPLRFGKQFAMIFTAGTVLFVAVAFQQIGIMFTTVGNAGFITGFYVVLTPVFGIFLGKKTHLPTWIGMVFALAGLYFITTPGDLSSINPGDLITVISAVFWACHIFVIDHLVQRIDPLVLSSGQLAWCGVYAFAAALTLEPFIGGWAAALAPNISLQQWITFAGLLSSPDFTRILLGAAVPILYGGLASAGIAYTLQIIAQKDAPPAHATIILCFEGCFAALGGILLRGEKPGSLTLLGFACMLCGMLITQWDVIFARKT